MRRRDRMKQRLSKLFGSEAKIRDDIADSNGNQLRGEQENREPNKSLEEEGSIESPETPKSRRIEDTPIRELWNVAYEKLREEDGTLIADYEAELTGVTAGVGLIINRKGNRREWMQAILSRKMEEVNNKLEPGSFKAQAKDTMQLVLNIVNSAKDYIGSAANANPYTSIAWTGVSFLLPLLVNISEEEASLTKGLDYTASLIVQSRMREELYVECYELGTHNHEKFRQSHTQYKGALIRLYMHILRFQATACCHYSKKPVLRHGLDAVKWKDWAPMVDEVREQERNFAAVEEKWRDIQRHEERATATKSLSVLTKQEHTELLNWLCDIDPSSAYNAARDKHGVGTCEWLINDSEEFMEWETSDRSFLWLHGKAGSGKSILTSSVIKHLQDRYDSELSAVLAYFYFSFSDPQKQNVEGMLASLTRQICSDQGRTAQVIERLHKYKIGGKRPDTESFVAMLIESASEFANAYVVIDALDECPLLNGQRGKLLRSLQRIIDAAPKSLHVFLTSRREPDIDHQIRPVLSSPNKIEIDLLARQKIINSDINRYIDSQLGYTSWPDSMKNEAKETIIEKADCMFQYVQLQLEALRDLSIKSDIREALSNLPTGLDATYNRILESIPPNFRERVMHSLKWLAFSRRVLFIEELAEIFTIRPHNDIPFNERERPFSPTDILKYFSSLIIVQEVYPFRGSHSSQIRLVHFSLKEYLVSKRIAQGPTLAFSFTEVNAQLSIVKSCLAYLNHFNHWVASHAPDRLPYDTTNQLYPLARYAAGDWMAHLEEIPRVSWSPDIVRDAATTLAVHSQSLLTLLVMDDDTITDKEDMLLKPYRYTAKHGHYQLTKMLIHQYVTREELDETLQQMAYEGNIDAMHFFLKAGADVNAQCGERGSALKAAAMRGNLDALRFLNFYRFEDNSSSNDGSCLLAWMDKKVTESLRFLLNSGAAVNMQVKHSGTALHDAIGYSYDADLDLLLERGANVNALSDYGTPLQVLCTNKFLLRPTLSDIQAWITARYVKKLLESGADPNLRCGEDGTALQLACGNECLFPNHQVAMEIIKLLVENETIASGTIINGFVVEAEEAEEHYPDRRRNSDWKWEKGERPIVKSAVEVVKLLLEKGATIDESLAFQEACVERDEERVRWMLDQGAADVNMKSYSRGTPLHAVLTYTRKGISEVRPYRSNFSSRNSLTEETLPIVQLLISKGAHVNHIGGRFGTALQAACSNEALSVEIIHYLLEQKADVNAEGGEYGTALIAACATDQEVDLVRLLLEHGSDVNAEGREYWGTALAAACKRGAPELVRLLLEHGANIHQKDYVAWNAAGGRSLYREHGIEMLGLLFGKATDVDRRRSGLTTALNATLEIWEIKFSNGSQERAWHERFCWLLEHGADVNIKAGKYGFALQTACAGELFPAYLNDINAPSLLTKFLLEKYPDININAQGGTFGSALQAAAFSGQTESVRLLLDRGADVNARGGKCGSALNAAIFRGYWDIVEILLQRGATPDYRLQERPDEEWLQRVREKWSEEMDEGTWRKDVRDRDWRCAIARYRKFWEVESGSAAGTESSI